MTTMNRTPGASAATLARVAAAIAPGDYRRGPAGIVPPPYRRAAVPLAGRLRSDAAAAHVYGVHKDTISDWRCR
jgi:hypothetical protein